MMVVVGRSSVQAKARVPPASASHRAELAMTSALHCPASSARRRGYMPMICRKPMQQMLHKTDEPDERREVRFDRVHFAATTVLCRGVRDVRRKSVLTWVVS